MDSTVAGTGSSSFNCRGEQEESCAEGTQDQAKWVAPRIEKPQLAQADAVIQEKAEVKLLNNNYQQNPTLQVIDYTHGSNKFKPSQWKCNSWRYRESGLVCAGDSKYRFIINIWHVREPLRITSGRKTVSVVIHVLRGYISRKTVGRKEEWKRQLIFIEHPLWVQVLFKITSFNCDNDPVGK